MIKDELVKRIHPTAMLIQGNFNQVENGREGRSEYLLLYDEQAPEQGVELWQLLQADMPDCDILIDYRTQYQTTFSKGLPIGHAPTGIIMAIDFKPRRMQ